MPITLERDDEATRTFPMWKKDYGARGQVMLAKDLSTGEPILVLQPAHNVGDKVPPEQTYRIKF